MSDSVQPHRWQPTRLPHPWDSPGKNTGVGCHFLLHARKWKVKVKSLSHVWLFVTPWTVAYQAPLSMGFSRQEYWSGFPLSSEIFLQGKMIKLINKISDRKVYLILWMRMLLVVWGMSRRLSDCYIRKDEWVQCLFGRIIWQGMVTHSAKKMGR